MSRSVRRVIMKHNEIILNNKFLKERKLVEKVCSYLEREQSIELSEDELVDILKDGEVCGFFNGVINDAHEIAIERVSDKIPTKGVLLFTTNLAEVSYDMLSGISMMICQYQGGLDMVVGALKDDILKENELDILFLALK